MAKQKQSQSKDTDFRRRELLAMIRGEQVVKRPAIGVKFEDTGEVLFWEPPTIHQLKIPIIVFSYDNKEQWLEKEDDEMVLYNKYGEVVLKRESNGKTKK